MEDLGEDGEDEGCIRVILLKHFSIVLNYFKIESWSNNKNCKIKSFSQQN